MKPKKRAVQHLLKCLYLYSTKYQPWYDSVVEAIEALDHKAAKKLRQGTPPSKLLRRLPNGDLAV